MLIFLREKKMEYEFVTWDFVEQCVRAIALETFDRNRSGVYGIPCGGLCLAVMLHHRLKIPLLSHAAKDCIIVDDISDTGRSLYHYTHESVKKNNYFITTLYYHRETLVVPHLWFKEKTDKWVVFPWECKENPE
jgi:hypoxanthine phosphoribosyltransferase